MILIELAVLCENGCAAACKDRDAAVLQEHFLRAVVGRAEGVRGGIGCSGEDARVFAVRPRDDQLLAREIVDVLAVGLDDVRLIDALEERGVIGPAKGAGPREILIDFDAPMPAEQAPSTPEGPSADGDGAGIRPEGGMDAMQPPEANLDEQPDTGASN